MHFVAQKRMGYKEKGEERSGTTVEPFDAVVRRFCATLKGEALFAARVVKSLVRSTTTAYGLFLTEVGENRTREMYNLIISGP
jgi:hypothetical protein